MILFMHEEMKTKHKGLKSTLLLTFLYNSVFLNCTVDYLVTSVIALHERPHKPRCETLRQVTRWQILSATHKMLERWEALWHHVVCIKYHITQSAYVFQTRLKCMEEREKTKMNSEKGVGRWQEKVLRKHKICRQECIQTLVWQFYIG